MDKSVLKLIAQLEHELKDKSVHYLVAIADGEDIKYKYDSKVAAKGMIDLIASDIHAEWDESRTVGEEGAAS